jgi:single-strand selective monofunctional uracil DNA glycosylase
MSLPRIASDLKRAVDQLAFAQPVAYVYNPLDYAWQSHRQYLAFAKPGVDALLVGMNPGPWGMAQTGVPFGEVQLVRDWMGIECAVGKPASEHPKRPVTGFDCHRSEVSGQRLWGWASERFRTPDRFFARFYVHNYCPLLFLEEGGRNRTPDKLRPEERTALTEACDRALRRTMDFLEPRFVIGVGGYAEQRIRGVVDGADVAVGAILHPSPASPMANRGWVKQAEKQLREIGVSLRG